MGTSAFIFAVTENASELFFEENNLGVFLDGRVSIDPADAGLIEYGSPNACSIEDHKSGRKGC